MSQQNEIDKLRCELKVQKRITQAAIDSNARWEDVTDCLIWDRSEEEYEGPITAAQESKVIAKYPHFTADIKEWVKQWNSTPRLTDEMLAAIEVDESEIEMTVMRTMQMLNFYTKLRKIEAERDAALAELARLRDNRV